MKRYTGRVSDGTQCGSFRPRGVGVRHPPHVGNVFANPEALQNPASLDCYEGFLRQPRSVINPISSPSPLSEDGGMGLKILSFQSSLVFLLTSPHPGAIQGPAQSHHMKTEDAPVARGNYKRLEALCQEPEAEINSYFLLSHSV